MFTGKVAAGDFASSSFVVPVDFQVDCLPFDSSDATTQLIFPWIERRRK